MTAKDERLLWILAVLLALWWIFRRAGFQFSAGVGPVGASFGLGTQQFTNVYGGSTSYNSGGGCGCGCADPTGPIHGDPGNYSQG